MALPDPVLTADVESMRLLLLPRSDGSFEIRVERRNFWTTEVVEAEVTTGHTIETIGYALYHTVMPWVSGQAAHSHHFNSETLEYPG